MAHMFISRITIAVTRRITMQVLNRLPDTAGAAHGLRQHSIGPAYPAIVVGRGDGSFEVHLGKHYCPRLTNEAAQELAERIGKIYREDGHEAAVRALTSFAVVIMMNG